MRKKFDQSLAIRQLELNGLTVHYEAEKPKQVEEEDEIIDVTGDYPSEPETIDQEQKSGLLSLEQPPSKIYYDHIEKEPSDGGFFDRDELEDEDERNDLVIDCRLGGEPGEKKTDNGNLNDHSKKASALAEPEIVFNFTLVDRTLVYNEPTIVQKLPTRENLQITPKRMPPVPASRQPFNRSVVLQQIRPSQTNSLKAIRFRPSCKAHGTTSNDVSKINGDRLSDGNVVLESQRVPSIVPTAEPIGSRLRPSAFTPPGKSQATPQSVPLKATVLQPYQKPQPSTASPSKSPKQQYRQSALVPQQFPYPPFGRYAKLIRNMSKHHHAEQPAPTEEAKLAYISYLPPQLGFGRAALHNLYNSQQPLDFSKDSPLRQYEQWLRAPRDEQASYGRQILQGMPIPEPLKPPPLAIRPKVVPFKEHPSISKILQPQQQETASKPTSKPILASAPQPDLSPLSSESFRSHVKRETNIFFSRRQTDILRALGLYSDEQIDQPELFRQLHILQMRFNRDYIGLARMMVLQHGYRFRPSVCPTAWDYKWKERPQDFVEYFQSIKNFLRPHFSKETKDIYQMVVVGLLEQFRHSIEHFLSRCLQLK